ncbi:hypothetical protein GCM10010245_89990 [Streptomyces spectabilis]|uniref:Uncharacterized protein n=1 Tax=Streptomyces spectabilis TaxID=68270 RepID=A0A7W8B3X1_STRST|nr:hypothetical protein [Streptomyces spectabilis]GGV56933.1 hypothetical protein GCM10010245_89990 [Streptomyces spectabilis]
MPARAATVHIPLAKKNAVAPAVADIVSTRKSRREAPAEDRHSLSPAAKTSRNATAMSKVRTWTQTMALLSAKYCTSDEADSLHEGSGSPGPPDSGMGARYSTAGMTPAHPARRPSQPLVMTASSIERGSLRARGQRPRWGPDRDVAALLGEHPHCLMLNHKPTPARSQRGRKPRGQPRDDRAHQAVLEADPARTGTVSPAQAGTAASGTATELQARGPDGWSWQDSLRLSRGGGSRCPVRGAGRSAGAPRWP